MADEADLGNERAEKILEAIISETRYQAEKEKASGSSWPHGDGCCKNCGERLDDGRGYCDRDCASDFEYRQRASRRNRKIISE